MPRPVGGRGKRSPTTHVRVPTELKRSVQIFIEYHRDNPVDEAIYQMPQLRSLLAEWREKAAKASPTSRDYAKVRKMLDDIEELLS